jgi:hypothetical protein
MKLIRLSSWGMCAVVLAFLITASPPHKMATLAKPGDGRANATTQPAPTDEWERVGQWLKDNQCDRRYQFVKNMREGPVKDNARGLLIRRVRQIEQIKDLDRKKAFIAELRAQDQIFAVQIRYRFSNASVEATDAMRKAVASLVEAQIAERQVQLDRINAEMAELKQREQPDHLDAIAQSYLHQAQIRRHLLHPPGQINATTEDESHDAEFKH